jgi:hypothetical protein
MFPASGFHLLLKPALRALLTNKLNSLMPMDAVTVRQ